MKRCDYCGQQSEDRAVACGGCGEPFEQQSTVRVVSTEHNDPALDPKIVATFHDPADAEMLKAELQALGIQADVPEEYGPSVFSALMPFQTLTVQVAAKDYEAARAIVSAFAPASGSTKENRGAVPPSGTAPEGVVAAAAITNPPGSTRCVSCGAAIPVDSILCPRCGWTQPRLA